MSKVKYIEAIYSQAVQFDLEKLEVDWNDVHDYWVKWGTLNVLYKDGSIKKYEPNYEPKIDWKHPTSYRAYGKDWKKVSYDE
tara:strand:+ start:1135 stop:1380 length:246 start_codon:yes stop_codon:yes gene_type:complete